MLQLQHVLVLLLIRVTIGQTKPIVKNGMLTEDVLGLLVILVLHTTMSMEWGLVLVQVDVLLTNQVVLEHETKHHAKHKMTLTEGTVHG